MTGYQEDERFLDAIADAEPYPYWMEDVDEPDSNPMLVRDDSCDLCIVGGGYTGLWTAILAKERNPSADVILIDSHEVGSAASGRNGGFMDSSLTHGIANAQQRFPKEVGLLEDLGLENLNQIEAAIRCYNIDCDFERNGVIEIASTRHAGNYLEEMREDYEQLLELGHKVEWLDQQAVQREVASPIFTGGMWCKDTAALVDPARLVWGLKSAAESLGVRIFEDTRATGLDYSGSGVSIETALADIKAKHVALATNAFKPLLKRMHNYIAPVYDYCLVTEPLNAQQLDSLGWKNRQGLSDISNQFHYYRLTAAAATACFGVKPCATVLHTRLATPALALQVHALEPKSCSICSTDARPKQLKPNLYKASRFRFHPSHFALLVFRQRAGHSAVKTERANATSGCAPSIVWVWASTRNPRASTVWQ
jgi:glycine/D-amino acid oxidase-like deaminating enzyme